MDTGMNDLKLTVNNISADISKKLPLLTNQIEKIKKIQGNIQSIMAGTSSNAYNSVMSSLANSSSKSHEAADNIINAVSKLKEWVSAK